MATVIRLGEHSPGRRPGTALEDARTAQLQPALAGLVRGGRVSIDTALQADEMAKAQNEPLGAVLARLGAVSSQDWAKSVASELGLETVGPDDLPREPLLTDQVSPRFQRHAAVLPVRVEGDRLWLAMADPANAYARRAVALATGLEVHPLVAALEDLQQAYARYWDAGQTALQKIVDDLGTEFDVRGDGDVEQLIGAAQEAPVVRLVNQLLTDALRLHASDIHIEPGRETLRVRYRVHGRLREVGAPPARLAAAVISRIKILAKLDIAERRLPQDGRARMTLLGKRIDLRVATAPAMHGESLVIRILDMSGAGVEFGELGLDPEVERRFKRQLTAPYGMILVTGPTGSGKTTTLYAGLRHLNATSDKLISIEDPVEYQIEGVTQIQVRADIGLDFARILRSVVRHDPNTIMVGETRDPETADIAVHAALTGHLLLTTLHTNSAAGAIPRLLDMGIEAYLLASVLRGIIGQRLVGVLCPACRAPHPISAQERYLFEKAAIEPPRDGRLFRPVGCEECEDTGFVGRVGIFEFLEIDDSLRELVRNRAATPDLQAAAIRAGMRTMFTDGLGKCLAGTTTLEEVCRVTEDW
jgi:general secretion pathway protein E